MYKFHTIALILLFASLFTACQKEVTVQLPPYDEKLVVDGKIETGLPPIIFLSTTKDIFGDNSQSAIFGDYISDATILISDGTQTDTLQTICSDNIPKEYQDIGYALFGIPPAMMSKFHICAYSTSNPAFFGKVGENYRIEIQYKEKKYSASTSIVEPTYLDSVYWKPEKNTQDYGYAYAHLTDPADRYNAYFWEVLRSNIGKDGKPIDLKFHKTGNPVFDDQFINGISFEFFYENPRTWRDTTIPENFRGLYKRNDTVIVKFSSLDKPTFNFLQKKYVQINNGGNPFSIPINVPTNISGGALGYFGGYSTTYYNLICR
jgi:hypothetical protein